MFWTTNNDFLIQLIRYCEQNFPIGKVKWRCLSGRLLSLPLVTKCLEVHSQFEPLAVPLSWMENTPENPMRLPWKLLKWAVMARHAPLRLLPLALCEFPCAQSVVAANYKKLHQCIRTLKKCKETLRDSCKMWFMPVVLCNAVTVFMWKFMKVQNVGRLNPEGVCPSGREGKKEQEAFVWAYFLWVLVGVFLHFNSCLN